MTETDNAARPDVPSYAALLEHVPPGSSWGVFDRDAERGTANFAGPAQVLDGVAAVTRGAVFSLDHALDAFDPPMARARSAPRHELLAAHDQVRDDVLHHFYPQASSQLDGLRHRRASGHGFYNGVPDDLIRAGHPALGVQRWAEQPIVGRGLLIDVEGLLAAAGTPLDHRQGPALDVDVLDRALHAQGERVRPGDLVLVHTGWARWFLDADPAVRGEVRDARRATGFRQTRDLPAWLWDHRVALFATDTFAVEVLPVATDTFLASAPEDAGMMHQELIAKLGVPLGELWNLTDLVADSRTHHRWDALVVVKPLHLVGGVGSPPNATALR
ncbi:cyclase family protein [Goodfellowiella coeruleoviolacea]|uniref:Cyclase n=1 Tax=Goodfellowiella coeruleoviolacea TaxID=334858 RepID=A0AAE3KHN0_9PSEU|nr:cyclase family protein [Goodfellowiella coeruleoviolacea]MCP2166594.1 putative cyclase [Goodfellowiella coeruleoviolacea]